MATSSRWAQSARIARPPASAGTRPTTRLPAPGRSTCCSRRLIVSAPHARGLDRKPLRAPGEIQLDVEVFLRAVGQHLRAYSRQAGTYPALERTHGLPLEAIGGIGVGMALADRLREQPLPPVRVVAVAAREVHLPAAQIVGRAAGLEARARSLRC